MNVKERDAWIAAVGACVPAASIGRLKEAVAALDAAGPGRWEASVSGRGLRATGLRFFGAGDYARFRAACTSAFGLKKPGPAAAREGWPWLSAAWDLKTGRWTALRFFGAREGTRLAPGQALAFDYAPGGRAAPPRRLERAPYQAGVFGEAVLDGALEDFAALCPLESLAVERSGWSLRLSRGLRWPLFARCDLAAAFAPVSSRLALLLLDRKVTELSFDGEALWAHCSG